MTASPSPDLEKEENKKKKKKKLYKRRTFPTHLVFKLQRPDKAPFALWHRIERREHVDSYFDRESTEILYALDRSIKGPMVVKDIKTDLKASVGRNSESVVKDHTLLSAMAKPGKSLFDSITAMEPFVTMYAYRLATIPVCNLFHVYGPK